jgi:hypothetical protein
MDAELRVDVAQVRIDRLGADEQPLSDLPLDQLLVQEPQDLVFSLCQAVVAGSSVKVRMTLRATCAFIGEPPAQAVSIASRTASPDDGLTGTTSWAPEPTMRGPRPDLTSTVTRLKAAETEPGRRRESEDPSS